MRNISDQIVLSATDLSNFLNCRHRTARELGEAYGKRHRPYFDDPVLEYLTDADGVMTIPTMNSFAHGTAFKSR